MPPATSYQDFLGRIVKLTTRLLGRLIPCSRRATPRRLRGVAQPGLERLHGVQKVASSNLVAPNHKPLNYKGLRQTWREPCFIYTFLRQRFANVSPTLCQRNANGPNRYFFHVYGSFSKVRGSWRRSGNGQTVSTPWTSDGRVSPTSGRWGPLTSGKPIKSK